MIVYGEEDLRALENHFGSMERAAAAAPRQPPPPSPEALINDHYTTLEQRANPPRKLTWRKPDPPGRTPEEVEAMKLYSLLDDHYALMARPVPKRGPVLIDSVNPGMTRPINHQHPAVVIDQTKGVSRTSSSTHIESNGEVQRLDLRSAGASGVTSTIMPGFSTIARNGEIQLPGLPANKSVRSAPIPTNVNVSSQNFHHPPLHVLIGGPVAKNINADAKKAGSGLPASVNIR